MTVQIKFLNTSNVGQVVEIPRDEFVIGRKKGCQLRLSGPNISRRHCVISILDGEVFIQDLESRNGTYLNGEPVEGKQPLESGDQLKIGKLQIELLIDQSTAEPISELLKTEAPVNNDSQQDEVEKIFGGTQLSDVETPGTVAEAFENESEQAPANQEDSSKTLQGNWNRKVWH